MNKRLLSSLRACLAIALVAFAPTAFAQQYPERPVKVVVTFGPGPSDAVARLIAQGLGRKLGQNFYVENRPGAFGLTGTAEVIRAKNDGYTLLIGVNSNLVGSLAFQKKPSYEPLEVLEPIGFVAQYPLLVAVAENGPKTLRELLAQMKGNAGSLNWGSANSMGRVAGEQFNSVSGVKVVHIPYTKEGEAGVSNALLAGSIQYGFLLGPSALGLVGSGKIRALAVLGKNRSPFFPGVPTVGEAGMPGYDGIQGIVALLGPKGMPREVVETLSRALEDVLKGAEVQKGLGSLATVPFYSRPKAVVEWIKKERLLWDNIIDKNRIERQ